ncbi:mechanosensitive ion channel family protein [Aquiflexum gelatinilyticum]|uniref:Mechanosensitive ion channel family protein n=1 Tax=Aquiflexum gelatinilyticum TaxID=2961943 RepID=A0A9X2SYR4_9BACT|nr:mechanosensitive ion channel family protein [Aquiflexum gelatinilyticum]MCR9013518.1 mechanosensitive ion channel family protein [Aquiflexum gelatinilyticum]
MAINRKINFIGFIVLLALVLGSFSAFSQSDSTAAESPGIRNGIQGYPVLGVMNDTVFYVFIKMGASSPSERAKHITDKIRRLYEDPEFNVDSLAIEESEFSVDLVYRDIIVTSVSPDDAAVYGLSLREISEEAKSRISQSIKVAKEERKLSKILFRVLYTCIVFFVALLLYWLLNKGYVRILKYLKRNRDKLLKNLSYKDYTFLTAEQELRAILILLRGTRLFLYFALGYAVLSIGFSIFPLTRGWADALLGLVWSPFRSILIAIWDYVPSLVTILVIVFVMYNVIRLVRYVFQEIEAEKLKISGFHADWAMPTYGIVRVLLYAFMVVLIFPYLPGSESNVFRGVSVFIGILFSLGSSSAIANMVAGLVITYMRPFKIGDKIKIGDTTGVVLEKTLLVTRVRTIKNEEITIPNSSVLGGNTTNYSTLAKTEGLIINTTVTIGYDVPWRETHAALIEAALRTDLVLKEPSPFVFQTSLDDFYVSYQLNAYTRESIGMAKVYSELHQNIQDVFFERGIEIMSPHYRAARDGNMSTIPTKYLPQDYQAPAFNFKTDQKKEI